MLAAILAACTDQGFNSASGAPHPGNEPPSAPVVAIEPAQPTTVDALVATDTVDADATTRGQLWLVTVTPSDGWQDGPSAEASVRVVNTPPSAPVVAIDPAAPNDTDDLACVVTRDSRDVDGDAVSYAYAWSVDGVDASVEGPVVAAARTTALENWTCTVAPSDGTDSGEPAMASATIGECAMALDFDGVDDGVKLATIAGTSAYTLELWVHGYPAEGAFGQVLGTNCGDLWWDATGFTVEVYPSCSGTTCRYWGWLPFTEWPEGWWHVAAVTRSATETEIYVDGASIGIVPMIYDGGVAGTFHGGLAALFSWENPQGYVNGRFATAGVRVSSGARYAGSFSPEFPLPEEADTAIQFRVDEGAGTVLTDVSGNGRDGAIRGGTWVRSGPPCR